MMHLRKLRSLFAHSPALRLLRAENAPFIVHFLHQEFRASRRIAIPHDSLRADLIAYQDFLKEDAPGKLTRSADDYLTDWCREETRILTRRVRAGSVGGGAGGGGETITYELTAPTEIVLRFLEENLEREADSFVGTESRMKRIVDTLREIALHSSDDPELHIAELERERDALDERISKVRETGDVSRYHDAQIRERFFDVVDQLRSVLGDFRAVEDSFRAITREVQQRDTSEESGPKGDLLGYALDAEDELRDSDQGVSFAGFQKEILVPERQERLRRLISEVRSIELIADQKEGLETLRHMMPRLTAEADQVMQTMRRLSASIRRFLDAREAGERREVSRLIGDIRTLARRCADEPPDGFAVEMDDRVGINTMAAREFWSAAPVVEGAALREADTDEAARESAFSDFARMRRLDWERMRDSIRRLTHREDSITLPRLLEEHPPESGAVEVLGYLQIAKDDGHLIIEETTDEIVVGDRKLTLPRVVFRGGKR